MHWWLGKLKCTTAATLFLHKEGKNQKVEKDLLFLWNKTFCKVSQLYTSSSRQSFHFTGWTVYLHSEGTNACTSYRIWHDKPSMDGVASVPLLVFYPHYLTFQTDELVKLDICHLPCDYSQFCFYPVGRSLPSNRSVPSIYLEPCLSLPPCSCLLLGHLFSDPFPLLSCIL